MLHIRDPETHQHALRSCFVRSHSNSTRTRLLLRIITFVLFAAFFYICRSHACVVITIEILVQLAAIAALPLLSLLSCVDTFRIFLFNFSCKYFDGMATYSVCHYCRRCCFPFMFFVFVIKSSCSKERSHAETQFFSRIAYETNFAIFFPLLTPLVFSIRPRLLSVSHWILPPDHYSASTACTRIATSKMERKKRKKTIEQQIKITCERQTQ